MKPPYDILPLGKTQRKRNSISVVSVSIYRRPDSNVWQTRVRIGKRVVRKTTGTHLRHAAVEFALMACRDLQREMQRPAGVRQHQQHAA